MSDYKDQLKKLLDEGVIDKVKDKVKTTLSNRKSKKEIIAKEMPKMQAKLDAVNKQMNDWWNNYDKAVEDGKGLEYHRSNDDKLDKLRDQKKKIKADWKAYVDKVKKQ